MWLKKTQQSLDDPLPFMKMWLILEVKGLNPLEYQHIFWPSQHWKNLGCHMEPSNWTTCHPVIDPYSTVNNLVNIHSQLLCHLPCHYRTATHRATSTSVLQDTFPVRCHVRIHISQSPFHVNIHTTNYHSYCHMSTCHWAIVTTPSL
jgi:hypothetical protein